MEEFGKKRGRGLGVGQGAAEHPGGGNNAVKRTWRGAIHLRLIYKSTVDDA